MTAIELFYFPGQQATVFLETLDSSGVRADGYTAPDGYPTISRVIFPDFTEGAGFPQNMTKLDTGLYFFQFTIPTGAASIGSYLIDGYYNRPGTGAYSNMLWQLVVTAPFGNFGTTSG